VLFAARLWLIKMNSKDKGLIGFLAVLLILLLIVSAFLLFNMFSSSKSTEDNKIISNLDKKCYDAEGYLVSCDSIVKEPIKDEPIDYINDKTYERRGGNGGGSNSEERNVCDDSQVIFRLYGDENTHGALWDESIYPVKVCYNEIFGKMFDTNGGDSHQCSGNAGSEDNVILRLIKTFNSHAEVPDAFSGNYDIPVCYGDLSCVSRDTECVGDEKEIVSLASESNAHLESRNVDNYNTRICCTSSGSF